MADAYKGLEESYGSEIESPRSYSTFLIPTCAPQLDVV